MRAISEYYRGWKCPAWYSEPVITRMEMPTVNLTALEPDKKQKVWAHIQQHHPGVGDLLKSPEFKKVKQELERHFGPVSIEIELHRIGGTLHGVCGTTKTDY